MIYRYEKRMNTFVKNMYVLDKIDSMSPEMQKAFLLYYIRCYGDISIICVDTEEKKVVWYNKPLYENTKKALVYINNQYIISLHNTILFTSNSIPVELSEDILSCINENEIITNYNISDAHGIFSALIHYKHSDSSKVESLCLFLGKMIYKYIVTNNKSIIDVSRDFEEYLSKYYEKIVYIVC